MGEHVVRTAGRGLFRVAPRRLALTVGLLGAAAAVCGPAAAIGAGVRDPTPLYAYYYIWFNPSSWNRAKSDYPLLGRYSSDEVSVMRAHARMAKQAGIDGFIVSWKSTPVLNPRLTKLVSVARRYGLRLAIIYEGLDFERRPVPVTRVASDLDLFVRRWARSPVFRGFGKPVVIWSGTWAYSAKDIRSVTRTARRHLTLLATERNARAYAAKAALFDGDAYYWSSVNPETYPNYLGKLKALSGAVHRTGGLWFAPAAPGFDGRLLGGHTVVDRKDGETLRREFDAAEAADPDAIGLISWNEFSENSYVEPSRKYAGSSLAVLADLRGAHFRAKDLPDSSDPVAARGTGPGALPVLTGFVMLLVAAIVLLRRRPQRRGGPRRGGAPGSRQLRL